MTKDECKTTDAIKRHKTINAIGRRAVELKICQPIESWMWSLDIEKADEFIKLDVEKLLNFDDPDFIHDLTGIFFNLDREAGVFENGFLPRCVA